MKKVFSPEDNIGENGEEFYYTDDWSERKLIRFANYNIEKVRYYTDIKLYIIIFLLVLILIFK